MVSAWFLGVILTELYIKLIFLVDLLLQLKREVICIKEKIHSSGKCNSWGTCTIVILLDLKGFLKVMTGTMVFLKIKLFWGCWLCERLTLKNTFCNNYKLIYSLWSVQLPFLFSGFLSLTTWKLEASKNVSTVKIYLMLNVVANL